MTLTAFSSTPMPFDLQPTLCGELLALRPLRPADYPDLFAVASDPLIWQQHPHKDRYQAKVFSGFFSDALQSGGALIATDVKDGKVIGSSRFAAYSEEKSEVEIGWTFLARSYWGGIYNQEMKRLMMGHAYRFVSSILFVVGSKNIRSQKAVGKIGGVRVGSRIDDTGGENFIYRITAPNSPQLRT